MIRTRGKGVNYCELWFDEELTAPFPDILICRQRSRPWPGARCTDFVTLLLDLTQDEALLYSAISRSSRYQIHRAEARDGGKSAFFAAPLQQLDAFCDFFDQFAARRSLGRAHRRWLREAAAAGHLVLTRAMQGNETFVWHAYIVAGGRARLLHSASHFRAQDNTLKALTGRLNRWLHWRDIVAFKQRGLQTYDLGGMFGANASASTQGVNHFKEEFGGQRSSSFDCTIALTAKGRIYLSLLTLRDRFSPAKAPS